MEARFVGKTWATVACDALLVPLFEEDLRGEGLGNEIDCAHGGVLSELRETKEWTGKVGEVTVIYRPAGADCGRLVLIGAGSRDSFAGPDFRFLFLKAVVKSRAFGLSTLGIVCPDGNQSEGLVQGALEGVRLGSFLMDEYKTVEPRLGRVEKILLVGDGPAIDEAVLQDLDHRAGIMANATNLARSWANEPGNILNPPRLAQRARDMAKSAGLQIEVWDESRMEEEGMHALLGVARGSQEPARLLILRHQGAARPESPPGVLVGKGVTFDTGGISIKPALHMEEMKTDKAGACAVLGAMQAIARLQVPQNVVGLVPVVENMPGGRAQRPGDVVRSMSGKTIEVINTDAEGRLILVDAIHYARQLKPAFIVDIATLTGACIVALGKVRAGIFCNSDSFCDAIRSAADRAGERVWPLPMDPEFRRDLKSEIADIKNVGERWGGAISAAKFLEEFVGGIPWCHIDMAGVSLHRDEDVVKGSTGFGVRTLVEIAADASLYPESE